MTGSTPAEGGKTKQKFPWQLIVAALAWASLGVTSLIAVTNSGKSGSEADQGSVDQVRGLTGTGVSSNGGGAVYPAVFVLIGIGALLLTALLLLGQGWARVALQVIGLIAVIAFAVDGAFIPAVVSMLAMVVGSILLLSGSVSRYLTG